MRKVGPKRFLQGEKARSICKERVKELREIIKEFIITKSWKFKNLEEIFKFLYHPFFNFIFDEQGSNKLWVFSVNYDPLIEEYCEYYCKTENIELFCGF